jgi:hypothetical protein
MPLVLIGPLYTPVRVGGLVEFRNDAGGTVTLDPCRIVKVWYNVWGGFYIRYNASEGEVEGLRRLIINILHPDGLVELRRVPAVGGGFRIGC